MYNYYFNKELSVEKIIYTNIYLNDIVLNNEF